MAARLARDRATVVDIGKCKLDLPWSAYYEKELDLRFSRSYGPGRYDPQYEVQGVDYPAGYVRWTERRNLACFVDLIARGEIDLEPLVAATFPLTEAVEVYERLRAGGVPGVGFLFEYPQPADSPRPEASRLALHATSQARPTVAAGVTGPIRADAAMAKPLRVGFIGAGNYARSMLLPHLTGQSDVELARVATLSSLSAINAQRKFGFTTAGTDAADVLADDTIDAVFIVTRHSSHAALACQALEAGKAVFVEKPLALSVTELDQILLTVDTTGNDRLMVGFNRRFAPMLVDMRARFGRSTEPTVARYLVNAGPLSANSWYGNEEVEGSRFVGEGGHFVDTLSWWIGAEPVEVAAQCAGERDDVQVTLRYGDGSLGTITYVVNGHPRFPKETFEVFSAGRSARLDNFRRATVWAGRRRTASRSWSSPDKGQRREVGAFLDSVRSGAPMPIPFGSLVATTRATLGAAASLTTRGPEPVPATGARSQEPVAVPDDQ
jgi:predicted dehydrogenase